MSWGQADGWGGLAFLFVSAVVFPVTGLSVATLLLLTPLPQVLFAPIRWIFSALASLAA